MDLTGVAIAILPILNYYYDSVDVTNEIIGSFENGKATEDNKKDLFAGQKLFIVGLNKVVLDNDSEKGFALAESYVKWSVKNREISSAHLDAARNMLRLGKKLDFHTGYTDINTIDKLSRSQKFLQDCYFTELKMSDSYSLNNISSIIFEDLKRSPVLAGKYEGISSPSHLLSEIVKNTDKRIFSNVVTLTNFYTEKHKLKKKILPSEKTINHLKNLAREADYGRRLKDEDYKSLLPRGPTQRNMHRMYLTLYDNLSSDMIFNNTKAIAYGASHALNLSESAKN